MVIDFNYQIVGDWERILGLSNCSRGYLFCNYQKKLEVSPWNGVSLLNKIMSQHWPK